MSPEKAKDLSEFAQTALGIVGANFAGPYGGLVNGIITAFNGGPVDPEQAALSAQANYQDIYQDTSGSSAGQYSTQAKQLGILDLHSLGGGGWSLKLGVFLNYQLRLYFKMPSPMPSARDWRNHACFIRLRSRLLETKPHSTRMAGCFEWRMT